MSKFSSVIRLLKWWQTLLHKTEKTVAVSEPQFSEQSFSEKKNRKVTNPYFKEVVSFFGDGDFTVSLS